MTGTQGLEEQKNGKETPRSATQDDATPTLLWIDLEMTGLDPLQDQIIEVAGVLTTFALDPIPGSEFHRVVGCPGAVLKGMDEWCTRTHGESGLTALVEASTTTLGEAEDALLHHLTDTFGVAAGTLYLAGNSIHADRMFLTLQMPRLVQFLHYRQVDVSTVKTLAQAWAGSGVRRGVPSKKGGHRAMDDILESIEELKHYRATWLRS